MKTKLLFISILIASLSFAQNISVGQTSDFATGTQGWKHQITNDFEPVQIATGGPDGAGDAFLRTTNSATNGAGSKHAVINDNPEWTGDYTAAGILAISFDVQNLGDQPLHLRVAVNKSFPDWAASTNATVISPGTTWTSVVMPITASDLTVSQGSATVADILADVDQIRIVSNDGTDVNQAIHKGQGDFVLLSDYDNITAIDVLNIDTVKTQNEFELSPNPATTKLNINLSNSISGANVIVYDVLGKKVYSNNINGMSSSIDVSKWNTGVYLVRVSTNNQTLTKRFVKQ